MWRGRPARASLVIGPSVLPFLCYCRTSEGARAYIGNCSAMGEFSSILLQVSV